MKFHIREAREKAGYSQKELAQIIGVAQNTFYGYESGKHDPKSELLSKIADACNVTVDFLLGRNCPDDTYKRKNFPSTDESVPREENISLEESNRLLVALGFIKEGEELSDNDLAFLSHIIALLNTWFRKGH